MPDAKTILEGAADIAGDMEAAIPIAAGRRPPLVRLLLLVGAAVVVAAGVFVVGSDRGVFGSFRRPEEPADGQ